MVFTEHFAEAVRLSMLPQNANIKAQSAGIKMFHIALTMGYVKRNVLHEGVFKSVSSCTEEASYGFTVTDTEQNILYACTSSCSKVVPFPYHFYRAERLQQG